MKYLPGPQQQIIKNTQELEDFMIRKVKQNQSTLDLNSPRNFIDSFLIQIQEVIPASVGWEVQHQATDKGRKNWGPLSPQDAPHNPIYS